VRDENYPTPEALLSLPIITMAEQTQIRGHRKERVGEVVSDKMSKTIVVRVERRFRHPGVGKVVTSYGKFYAHDEGEIAGVAIWFGFRKPVPFRDPSGGVWFRFSIGTAP